MRIVAIALLLCLALQGCQGLHEYELDESSFKSDTFRLLEQATKFDIPENSKGLNFRYKPPIDSIYFAKIEIPQVSSGAIQQQIEQYKDNAPEAMGFANETCAWWPKEFKGVIASRNTMVNSNSGSYYLSLYFTKEEERLILYVKYFTI